MRADKDQVEFCKWLCDVGSGKNIKGTNELKLPKENLVTNLEDLIEFTFGDLFTDPEKKSHIIGDAAILAPTNQNVFHINSICLNKMPGITTTYLSTDELIKSTGKNQNLDPLSIHKADWNIESIHNETPTGLPPHKLELKVKI